MTIKDLPRYHFIKNVELLDPLGLTEEQIKRMEYSAHLHRRYASFYIKVLSLSPDKLEVEIKQGKSYHENYFDAEILKDRATKVFSDYITDREIKVHAIPYKPQI